MTRILRLLLIAAVAWPLCHPAAAQEVTPPEEAAVECKALNDTKAEISVGRFEKFQASKDSADAMSTMSLEQRKIAEKPFKTIMLQNVAPQNGSMKVVKMAKSRADVPAGYSQITLNVADNPWTDGSGYQMLLDADHSTYGSTIPTSGALTTEGDATAETYALFEYKIPENADGAINTSNMVASGSASITIPAGTYDWCITNPSPGDRIWIASEYGDIQGRYDDYVFESGFAYTFTLSSIEVSNETYDNVSIDITSNYENPTNLEASNIYKNQATLTWAPGGGETSWNVQYKNKGDFAWTSAGNVTSTNYLLENLSALTEYQVRVQGVYSDGLSGWAMVTFTTTNDEAPLCDSEDMGQITYNLNDSYGDGWNGCAIKIVDVETGNVITTLTIESGSSTTGTVSLCYGRTVNFVWTKGSYAYETSFTITDPEGEIICSSTDGSSLTDGDVLATYTMHMPIKPTNLAVRDITHKSATVTWTGVTDDYNLRYRPTAGGEWVVVNNATSPYAMTSLAAETQYEVQVQGVLDNYNSDWTNSVTFTTLEGTTLVLDFGSVDVNTTKTLIAKILNESDESITATLTTSVPFSVVNSSMTLPSGLSTVDVTFTPTDAINYNGVLTVVAGDNTITIALKGVGSMSGPEAIRDEAFFEGIEYTWTDDEGTHTSTLADIATKPEQIIAMIKEVYTNKSIPGNFKRGCTAYGNFTESFSDVSYPAIGKIEWVGPSNGSLNDLSNYAWTDSYGWGIDTKKDMIYNKYTGYSSSYPIYYTHFDQTEYKPDNEGVTLLLVEVADDYDLATNVNPSSTGAQYLKDVIGRVIKSVRVVTQAKRTGTGYSKGTLFNVDCDKMNKFYFMAKGQLRRPTNSKRATGSTISSATFCPYPMYVYSQNYFGYSSTIDKYVDEYNARPFYQMFEQFSPVSLNTGANINDLYSSLTKMTSFNVVHDCITVPFATHSSEGDVHHGHQFMMYGLDSGAADCQDVRDLMFFVPDYRMMDWGDDDGNGRDTNIIPYTNYNEDYAPTMGLYVILQDAVEPVTEADDYYKLKLTWDSNMDEFLPGEQQEYQLYQVITDEFGVSKWVPVYKRNAQGQYWNPTTQAWQADTTGAEPVVLTLNPNDSKTYTDVYELRGNSSREVTYAIRGRDTGHFLSLQMSNEQSYVIPGKDPAEMVLMSSATIYSRYEAQNENNCYSNKIQMKAAPRTIKASYLPTGSTMTLNRSYAKVENGATVTVTEPIATLTINTSTKKFTVSGSVLNDVESLFPKGTQDGKTAGYHANNFTNNQISYTTQTISGTEYINFNLAIWDNFVVNVSKNEHPGLYTYQLRFNTAESFVGLNGSTNEAYSQPIRVYVYKTDSKVNSYTQTQVDDDATGALEVSKDIEFSAQVMLSSKGEILRYDAYRWNAGAPRSIVLEGGDTDEDEEDADPDGIAGNQGDSYSITMNAIGTSDYYVGDAVAVSTTNPQNWAKFVDYYPKTQPEAQAFVYAPVVELFTKGYQEGSTDKQRGDYNTYGGPLKVGTTGKLHVQVVTPEAEVNPLMSTYSWEDENGDKYAYYNIKLNMDIKKVPQGYEFYKIRAWRILDEGLQGEEYDELKNAQSPNCRVGEKVLFEDITYPDCDASSTYTYKLGSDDKSVTVEGADGQSHTYTSYTGTFGARKLRTKEDEQGVITELPVTFLVRIYYTKAENLTNSQSVIGSKADGDVVTNPDAEFYAVDYTFTEIFTSDNVPTAIENIDASEVVSRKYYNVAGIESDTPFKGVNIVVTRYSDGSTTTTKILK